MQSVTVNLRVTMNNLMCVKDYYQLHDTEAAVRSMFEKQYDNLRFVKIISSDPDPINQDAVLIRVEAECIE